MSGLSLDWKRGDSFVIVEPGMLIADPAGDKTMTVDGKPVPARLLDMSGWTVQAQVRAKAGGTLVADLELVWIDRAYGSYQLQAKDTTSWPVGALLCDVQFTDPEGFIASSETLTIKLLADQTQPGV